MYADDVKIYKTVRNVEDSKSIQAAIDYVCEWSDMWNLPLSAEKTTVFRLGNSKRDVTYKVGNVNLQFVDHVRDLGFLINNKLSFDDHYKSLVNKANYRTYNLFKALKTKNSHILLKAYKTYVRPILESATTVFSPYKKKDICLLESAQNSFTRKLIMRCSGLSYELIPNGEERCKQLGLLSLASRRKTNDIIMAFKILTGRANIDCGGFFVLMSSRTRGGRLKLHAPLAKTQIRASFFSNRILSTFNKVLRNHGVLTMSLKRFRNVARAVVSAEVS